ncbi:hypothetical protein DFH27DRAFT_522051 [Peziza echinospora]|nr:hypothetical protein DFH27DRAFT_522051 [Peziza echinospora]
MFPTYLGIDNNDSGEHEPRGMIMRRSHQRQAKDIDVGRYWCILPILIYIIWHTDLTLPRFMYMIMMLQKSVLDIWRYVSSIVLEGGLQYHILVVWPMVIRPV